MSNNKLTIQEFCDKENFYTTWELKYLTLRILEDLDYNSSKEASELYTAAVNHLNSRKAMLKSLKSVGYKFGD